MSTRALIPWFYASLLSVAGIPMQSAFASHATLPDGVTPVMATWLWGYHVVPASITKDNSPRLYSYPHTDAGSINNPPWTEVATTHMKIGTKAPAVVLLHGCAGIARGAVGYRVYLLSEGYAVFQPDSLARPGRPPCLPGGGGYNGSGLSRRGVGAMRYEEIAYALDRIRELPWIDHQRIILMGISEGGWAVSRWEKPGFEGHIIVSAGCVDDSGRPRAPDGVPVLAILGEEDRRRCTVARTVGGSRSIVIADAPHGVSDRKEFRDALDAFLRECCK